MLPPELADDGHVLYGDIRIGGETFHNDGLLQIRTGAAADHWLRDKPAPVGSVHRDGQQCAVCHLDHNYAEPTTVGELTHRAHQVRAAFERAAGVGMGEGMAVTCYHELAQLGAGLMLRGDLADATRFVGLEWRSDRGWLALSQPERAGPLVERHTLLGATTWMPLRVAVEALRHASGWPAGRPSRRR
jgi:hypothetical protein